MELTFLPCEAYGREYPRPPTVSFISQVTPTYADFGLHQTDHGLLPQPHVLLCLLISDGGDSIRVLTCSQYHLREAHLCPTSACVEARQGGSLGEYQGRFGFDPRIRRGALWSQYCSLCDEGPTRQGIELVLCRTFVPVAIWSSCVSR